MHNMVVEDEDEAGLLLKLMVLVVHIIAVFSVGENHLDAHDDELVLISGFIVLQVNMGVVHIEHEQVVVEVLLVL
jgi:hypothetical protein